MKIRATAGVVACALLVAGCAWYAPSEPAAVRIARIDFAEPTGAAPTEPLRVTLDHNQLQPTDTLAASVLMDSTLMSNETGVAVSVVWTSPSGGAKTVSETRWTGEVNALLRVRVDLRDAHAGRYALRVTATRPDNAGVVSSQAEFDVLPPMDTMKTN